MENIWKELFKLSANLTFEYVPCPICSGDNAKEKVYLSNYRIVQCKYCGLYYENPRPLLDDIPKLYNSNYFKFLEDHSEDNLEVVKLNLRDIEFEKFEKALGKAVKRILDIGCERGTFLKYMRSSGWHVYGVEIGETASKYAKEVENLDVFHGELLNANYESNYFDVVNLSHVIEHVSNPLQILKECHRVLKRGGSIILTTDNFDSFARTIFKNKWRGLVPIHIVFFSQRTLKKILKNIGFQVTHAISWGGVDKGTVSPLFKRAFDYITKKLNIGDVMLICGKKI